jgi:hypothetical protein
MFKIIQSASICSDPRVDGLLIDEADDGACRSDDSGNDGDHGNDDRAGDHNDNISS